MARRPRHVIPGQALHLIQRGNNRQAMFFADTDFPVYHEALVDAALRYGCAVHAYVFMTNHVHLLLTPSSQEGPSRVMQSVGRRYVRYVNTTYQRTGTLWEGRFKSAIVDSERYFLACSRYIELNPVRAGMVNSPQDYPWSSYRHNAQGKHDSLLKTHRVFQRLGSDQPSRRDAYRHLFRGALGPGDLERIRFATEAGTVIGNDRFREQVEKVLKRRIQPLGHGGDRKSKRFRDQEL
jgi:putative transposase